MLSARRLQQGAGKMSVGYFRGAAFLSGLKLPDVTVTVLFTLGGITKWLCCLVNK